jgi:hypothetical protein
MFSNSWNKQLILLRCQISTRQIAKSTETFRRALICFPFFNDLPTAFSILDSLKLPRKTTSRLFYNIMEDETLTALKDFAANSFIPKAVLVGVLGNFINFVILSRWVAIISATLRFLPCETFPLDRASKAQQTFIYRYWLSPTHLFCCWFTCHRNNITTTCIVRRMKFIGACLDWVNGSTRRSVSVWLASITFPAQIESGFQCTFQSIWLWA